MSEVLTLTFADILSAHERIAPYITRTPSIRCAALSKMTGADIWLKLENLQAVASFKERGAANKLALLTEEEKRRGVIAVSAGNHSQGVARHASLLGIDATIVMPRHTPSAKVERTRGWGARVVTEGEDFAEARKSLKNCDSVKDWCLSTLSMTLLSWRVRVHSPSN